MASRNITTSSRRYSRQLIDTLMSLFALELLAPAPELYLFSAWVTDVELLDNSFGQYRALLPESAGTHVRLSSLLNALAERGAGVYIALRDDPINADFANRLNHPFLQIKQSDDLHHKVLVNEHFCWSGSMNFTYSGIHKNPESISLTSDTSEVSRILLEMKQQWELLQ